MASAIDIVNLALGHLGDDANVSSFDEDSVQAEHAKRFYPIALDTLTEQHAWSFAVVREQLALLDQTIPGWAFVYAAPNLMLRPLEVYPKGVAPDVNDPLPFEVETDATTGDKIVLTNVEDAYVRFIRRVTDTTKFNPTFVDALGWLLASMMAGPLLKGDTGNSAARECYKVYLSRLADATGSNANSGRRTQAEKQAVWIANR